MDLKRMQALLSVGRWRSALLDVARMPQFDEWVRVVTIKACGDMCAVEFSLLSAEEYDTHGLRIFR